ncbi:rap guanine nucleotide exchange factor 1 isoform X1 [Gadus morhua]|uniref:rap guanine nucleotide exchange factor 1 isoform X1 n=1 Tax=Gadus morhua TaxID=8049 RepID=UPI0011B7543C|nr:rap guanine nucleotide exchange factor 1 isoform X1 [Gadus morhua]
MSGRLENKTDSQRSQLASLTMRLKDKLHPPRIKRSVEKIKRTPSQASANKPHDLDLTATPPLQRKSVCVLEEQERAVLSALRYFKKLLDTLGGDQPVMNSLLSGSAGQVLETVHNLVQLEPHIHNSKTVTCCLSGLYSSLAQLIHWADQLMLQGIVLEEKEAIATVVVVTKAVLDGVKELVRLAAERQDGPSPSSPIQPLSPKDKQNRDRRDSDQSLQAVGQDEIEDQHVSPEHSQNPEPMATTEESAPPKPPKPFLCTAADSAPALPPKKRHSIPGPAPSKVAIVAPMRRESEPNMEEYEECLKVTKPSVWVETLNTHFPQTQDTDYDSLSLAETMPPPTSSFPPLPLPPALPQKTRRSSSGAEGPFPALTVDLTGVQHCSPSLLSPSGTPPPLPDKKRHIHQYLKYLESYRAPAADMLFYQRPADLGHRYNSRQQELVMAYQLTHTHLDPPCPDTAPPEPPGHAHHDTPRQAGGHGDLQAVARIPAPALPPKRKQLTSQASVSPPRLQPSLPSACPPPCSLSSCPQSRMVDSSLNDQEDNDDTEDSSKQGKECNQSNGEDQEENEELLLVSRQEVLDRLTMKSEGEEGPGVKAASPDILLVHATLTDSNEQVLYCEVFLSTYRTFISPHDVISKLQFRYKHLCQGIEPSVLGVSKNTFLLLVRVVDELCSIELDGDLQLLLMDLVFSLVIKGELGLARLLRSNILSKLEERRQMIESPSWLRPLSARGVAARPGSLLDFKSHDVAEQLTFMDSKLFYKIELPEVLLWSMEQNEERSPNLTEFTQHFNNVSFWVRSVIILQEKAQEREKLVLKFLKVMKHLRKLNNFNSYLSILSALDSAPLRRLDWQKHTAEALEEFSALIDSSSSFRTYRTALSEVEPPCIPYLGLILQDLTFVHLGNPDRLMTSQGSMVNFSKRWQQFNILDTLRSFQQICYSLQPKSEISSFFNDFSDHLAEEALWELSLKIRPRNIPKTNQR